MASLSKIALSGKAVTDPKNLGKMSFLDMSLDDIIILRKIEYPSFKEDENEIQKERERNSVSVQQSNGGEHRQQRGSSVSRNNVEERNDKKSHQGSGFKSGQSPLNRKSLTKQDKCSDNSKTQAKRDPGQSKENKHHLERSQGQLEEHRHYSEKSRGHRRQQERSRGQLERSRSPSERSHGHSKRSRGHSERSRGHSERSRGHSERSRGHSERSHGQSERSHGQSERSHGQSGSSHDQSGKYRRYSPVERFRTSPKIRSLIIKTRDDYLQEQLQQRNDQTNMSQNVSLEKNHNGYEDYEGGEGYFHHRRLYI